METREQLQQRRDELTALINAAETWDETYALRQQRTALDAVLNKKQQIRDERNAKARARRARNPQPNGGHTGRGQRR